MGINARGLYSVASDAEDPIYVKGNWYVCNQGAVIGGVALTAGLIRLRPFRIRQFVNIAQIGSRITTLAAAGNVQLGIYGASANTLLPTGGVLARTGNLATDAAGLVAGSLFNAAGVAMPVVQLPRGIYWFAVNADNATVVMQIIAAADVDYGYLIGSPSQANISTGATTASNTRTFAATFGTWPDLTGQTMGEVTNFIWALGQFQVAP